MLTRTVREGARPQRARALDGARAGAEPEDDEVRIRDAGGDGRAGAAVELIMRLPGGMLRCTSARFPHVLQRIALAWADPDRLQRILDELMYDERGDRSGFPFEVLSELAELRRCHERWVGPRTSPGR